jgi:hypothetical protein
VQVRVGICMSPTRLRRVCSGMSQVRSVSCAYISSGSLRFVSTRKMKSNKEKQEGTIRALGNLFVAAVRCVCLVVIGVPASSYTRSCVTRIRRAVLPLDPSSCHEIVRLILGKANNR